MELKDKVCLITGASGGIGEALSYELAGSGAKVVLFARRAERLAAVAARIGGESSLDVAGDVTKKGDMEAAVAKGLDRFGRLDVLINNAGVAVVGPLSTMPQELMDQGLRTNVVGPVLATQAALLEQGSGMIVNVSSGQSLRAGAIGGVYSASKAAMNLISASLREELREKGIMVMTVHQGFIDNDFRINALSSKDAPSPGERGRPPAANRRTSEDAARDIVEAMRTDQSAYRSNPEQSLQVPL